jgi:hypothetical protein
MPHRLRWLTLASCLLVVTLGCGDDTSTEPETAHSIDQLLADWVHAIEQRDIDLYRSIFSEDMRFWIDPEDREYYDPERAWFWDRDCEVRLTQAFFDFPGLSRTSLSIGGHPVIGDPSPEDGSFPAGTQKVAFSAGALGEGESREYGGRYELSGRGTQWVFVAQNPSRLRAGKPMWEVIEWRERRNGFSKSSEPAAIIATWGAMRAYFADPTERPQTVEMVLEYLSLAHQSRLDYVYDDLLSYDFMFVLDPVAVAEDPDLPASWNRNVDVEAVSNMFRDDDALAISVEFDPTPAVAPDPEDGSFPEGALKVTLKNVTLRVMQADPTGGAPIGFVAEDDEAILFLAPHPTRRQAGQPVWQIVQWQDVRIDSPVPFASIEMSWGQVKALFRR